MNILETARDTARDALYVTVGLVELALLAGKQVQKKRKEDAEKRRQTGR